MKIEDVQVVGIQLVLATTAEVDALESRHWITVPDGYRDYVTRLGEGALGGSFVRIYPPWRIEKELSEWRRRVNKYWFWDEGRELLPKERALECVIIGDTVNGDELVFHPTRPTRLFILPHDSGQVFEAGSDLMSAIEWICSSGELVDPFDERNFEPFDSRVQAEGRQNEPVTRDPEGESLDDIVGMAERWVKRHKVRAIARKGMRQQTAEGGEANLIYEGILIDAPAKSDIGYSVAWQMIDKNGKPFGIFRWHKNDGSYGSAFEPVPGG